MTIQVKISPVRGVNAATKARIDRIARRIKDTARVNREVSVWLVRWVNENFRTQGALVQAGGWAPLKTGGRYHKNPRGRKSGSGRKRRYDPYAKVLQDSGRLRASFHGFYTRKTAGVGSDLSYAPYHDLGAPRAGIPQRRILPTSEDASVITGVLRIYESFVRRSTR